MHGLTDQEVAQAPRLVDLWPEVEPLLRGASRIVAYNAAFDQARLVQSASHYGLEAPWEREDLMQPYADFRGTGRV